MKNKKKKHFKDIASPPGTLIYTGEIQNHSEMSILDYDEKTFNELNIKKVEDCFPYEESPSITWINIVGLNDVKNIEKIGEHFKLHELVLEDILNINQRPKVEDFENYIFIVLKMLNYNEKSNEVESEQVSIILGKNYIITFQERKEDVFDLVRERIRSSKGIIRKMGADYLAYALIDAIVDTYFIILENVGEKLEDNEDLTNSNPDYVKTIHKFKRNLILLRKSVWPLREVLGYLEKTGSDLINESSVYFRDVYDHTIQVIDTIETYRDLAAGMLEIYLSRVSNKMNEIMKVLTIIATIFMPLTFISGIYGMNFKHMPELDWKYGYPVVLGVMLSIGLGMVFFFKKKKWF